MWPDIFILISKRNKEKQKKEKRKPFQQAGFCVVARFLRYYLIPLKLNMDKSKNIAKPGGL
jgi:hypothetical protein